MPYRELLIDLKIFNKPTLDYFNKFIVIFKVYYIFFLIYLKHV